MRSGKFGDLPRFAGDDAEFKALVAAAMVAGLGAPALAATVDATSGPTNWANSGEIPLNTLIALMPAVGALGGGALAVGLNRPASIELQKQVSMRSPEYREMRDANKQVTEKLLNGEMISEAEYQRVQDALKGVEQREQTIEDLYAQEAQKYRDRNDAGGYVRDAYDLGPPSRRMTKEEALAAVKRQGRRRLYGGALLGALAAMPATFEMLEDKG